MVTLFWKNSNLCDHIPPMLQTTCDRKTALSIAVHHAVKKHKPPTTKLSRTISTH